MCFSAKMKTPKINTNQVKVPEPAPLDQGPTSVEWGNQGSDDDNKTSSEVGVKSATVDKSNTAPKTGGIKASIRAKASTKK